MPGKYDFEDMDDIGFHLGRAYYSYITTLEMIIRKHDLDAHHVKPGMGNILFALFERDDQTISQIAGRLKLSKSTMTGMIARIRAAGLITARTDPRDRRATRIKLTPLAQSIAPRCRQAAAEMEELLTAKLSKAQSKQLRRMLGKLTVTMTDWIESQRKK